METAVENQFSSWLKMVNGEPVFSRILEGIEFIRNQRANKPVSGTLEIVHISDGVVIKLSVEWERWELFLPSRCFLPYMLLKFGRKRIRRTIFTSADDGNVTLSYGKYGTLHSENCSLDVFALLHNSSNIPYCILVVRLTDSWKLRLIEMELIDRWSSSGPGCFFLTVVCLRFWLVNNAWSKVQLLSCRNFICARWSLAPIVKTRANVSLKKLPSRHRNSLSSIVFTNSRLAALFKMKKTTLFYKEKNFDTKFFSMVQLTLVM